ncbi:uncharacterized protein LOC133662614 [Entelurus aequoreus]|uniref:uncharacterized protein LOC133662614 n=1 Tax=Entelurus aequoreus TaxID=161455 RepID=UPI002B1DDDC5|nr:uncharacterized protein LOC133662614 [Entelurus aequoreus]
MPLTGRIDRKSIILLLLLLSGDTELNPGPATTRLMLSRLAKTSNATASVAIEANSATGSSQLKLTCAPTVGGSAEDFAPFIDTVGGSAAAVEDDPVIREGSDSAAVNDAAAAVDGDPDIGDCGELHEMAGVHATSPRSRTAEDAPYTGFRGAFTQTFSLFSFSLSSKKPAKRKPNPSPSNPTWPPPPSPSPPPFSPSPFTWRTTNMPLSPLSPCSSTATAIITNNFSGQYHNTADSDALFGSSGLHIIHLNVNSLSGAKLDQIREMFLNTKVKKDRLLLSSQWAHSFAQSDQSDSFLPPTHLLHVNW